MASNRKKRKSPPKLRTGRDIADARAQAAQQRQSKSKVAVEETVAEPISLSIRVGFAALLVLAFAWSYFPTFVLLQGEWERLPDYSHGYLVVPFALVLAWLRREKMPNLSPGFSLTGLGILAAAVAMRWFGDAYYYPVIGSNSIVVWVAGAVWLTCGPRFFVWASPSILFLAFMVPMPSRFSSLLSGTLQRFATMMSTWCLQLLGQPALSEGNTISLGDHMLEVAQACSGLRIFVGIFALAFFVIFMTRRTWWQNLAILASVLPIALVANTLRIVFTGLYIQWVPGEESHKVAHDVAGWVMIPLACALFAGFLWYMTNLVRPVRSIEFGELRSRSVAS